MALRAGSELDPGDAGATANRGAGPVVAHEPGFDLASAEYHDLFASSAASAFQHPLWLSPFYAGLAPFREAEPLIVTIRDGGRLVAVIPLIRRRLFQVSLIESTDLGVSDYAAPVVAGDWRPPPDLPRRLLAALPSHDALRIRPIREQDLACWQALLGGTAQRLDFSAHAVALDGNFAAWRARSLAPEMAGQLDRKKKRFRKLPGAGLRLLTEPGEITGAIDALRRLRAGRFEGDLIQADPVRDFYAAVAVAGRNGFARTYALQLQEEGIGYVFGLSLAGRFYYLLIGCDYARHGKHSPGLLMYDGIIEDWMAAGGTVFDFTIGDEPFKRDFGTAAIPIFELTRAATWRGQLALGLKRAGRHLRDLKLHSIIKRGRAE